MDHLHRELAPISDAAWKEIDDEASRTMRHILAARALLDFSGPHGWRHSAVSTGRVAPMSPGPRPDVQAAARELRPLLELRTELQVSRAEIDAIDRGAYDPDLSAVTEAAKAAALAEDTAIFHGYAAGGIRGITEASPHDPITISDDYTTYPSIVARAVSALMTAGVGGPYAIARGPRCHLGVVETTEHGGYPVFEHLRRILGGPVLWAPGVDGAVVLSTRGDDYVIECGQDFSIGYLDHTADVVRLYLEESFTLVIKDDAAAVPLVYAS